MLRIEKITINTEKVKKKCKKLGLISSCCKKRKKISIFYSKRGRERESNFLLKKKSPNLPFSSSSVSNCIAQNTALASIIKSLGEKELKFVQ